MRLSLVPLLVLVLYLVVFLVEQIQEAPCRDAVHILNRDQVAITCDARSRLSIEVVNTQTIARCVCQN